MTRAAPALVAFAGLLASCREQDPGAGGGTPPAPVGGGTASSGVDPFARERGLMAERLREVVKDEKVLAVMGRIPRHEFVPQAQRVRGYVNTPLPISESETISAPDIVAIMTEALALRGDERVLEIGTGSGYQAAILGELSREVFSVEIRPALAARARQTLEALRSRGVLRGSRIEVIEGDGFQGYAPGAPYDAIIVTAAPRQVPTELINQMRAGGRMVIPLGDFYQELQLIQKSEDGRLSTKNILPVRFVPMVGADEIRR